MLGFGAKRLNDLHKAVLENFRQLSAWAIEDGVDVALERFCRCARDAYKTDVQVEDIPDAQALHQQQRQTRQALDGLAERAWMVEPAASGWLPAAGPGGSGKAHPDRAAGPGHAGELGEEAGEMTEIWAGICRLIRIQAYDVQIWLLERKKWLLDCRIGALDAQIWCCKKVIEITEAWE